LAYVAPSVFLEHRARLVRWDTTANPVLRASGVRWALKARADPKELQATTEPAVLLVKVALLALPAHLAAMACLALKVSQDSRALLAPPVLPALLVHQPLPLFLPCLLAPVSSTAWCALLSQGNQSQAQPYHSPGTALSETPFCPAPQALSASMLFLTKLS